MDFGESKPPKSQATKETDRISTLPNEILGHILSLLPTKYAVATSILSSKWRNLYTLTRNLDFDDSLSIHPEFRLSIPDRRSCFREFVNRVLAQCINSPITRFRLKCGNNCRANDFTHWQRDALALRDVTELDLSIDSGGPFEMQLPELACRNLKYLKLAYFLELRVLEQALFPCLKVLFFKHISFQEDGLSGILSRCPFLEEFVMISCGWKGSHLCFSNRLLQRLTIDVVLGGLPEQHTSCSIHFNVPKLVYLKYNELLPDNFFITNLNSVVHAHLEVDFYYDEVGFDEQKICNTMLDLIKGVSNCKKLYLSARCLEALAGGVFELPVFEKLTRLKLCQGFNAGWKDVLLNFLNNLPCLKYLTLTQVDKPPYTDEEEQEKECLLLGEPVPSCVSLRLEKVKIKNFACLRGETDMIKYFLAMAEVLKRMVIRCRKRNVQREAEINHSPRSDSCHISLT